MPRLRNTQSAEKTTKPTTKKPTITSGIRIGTPAVSSRGMGPGEMSRIAKLIGQALVNLEEDEATKDRIRGEVKALARGFPLYPDLVDERAGVEA